MLKWENIKSEHAESVFRTPVFGGWLVKIVQEVFTSASGMQDHIPWHEKSGHEWTSSVTFVPDPDHKWDLSQDYKNY